MKNELDYGAKVNSPEQKKAKEITSESLNEGLKSRLQFEETWVDRFAAFLTAKSGTVPFLMANGLFFLVWILWNSNVIPGVQVFDPFPFGFLTMMVSLEAIFLSIVVLISQNREGRVTAIRQQIDFEINVRAEHEITKVLEMLCDIQNELGMSKKKFDVELKEMIEKTDLKELKERVEEIVDKVEDKAEEIKDNVKRLEK